MLEVLFDDDDSSGSDDVEVPNGGRAGPLPNAQLAGSQPQWQQTVADELTALHAALETRARALNEREAALAERETRVYRRETQLASDDGLLRAVLEKESSRLLADAQVPASTLPQPWPRCCLRRGNHAPYPHGSTQLGLAKPNPKPIPWQARLDTAAGLQVQRLEATVATLRSQCRQLQLASGQPTPALWPRAGRPVTPSRGRRKSVEQWSSPSIAPCEAPRGTAAAAAAAAVEPGGATAVASAAPEAAAEGLTEGAGRPPLRAPASSTSTPASSASSASTASASTVRELELRLERATAATAGLALLWGAQRYPQLQAMPGAAGPQLAEAWSRAVPGAADALQALQGPQQGKRVQAERDALAVSYLHLLWHARPPAAAAAAAAAGAGAAAAAAGAGAVGRAGGGEAAGSAAGSAAAWERRLLRHLSCSASHSQGGACFGAGSHGALHPTLPILYLLWLCSLWLCSLWLCLL